MIDESDRPDAEREAAYDKLLAEVRRLPPPTEPPPGSIVVFGDGGGYPVTRGMGTWHRTGWSGGKSWEEVLLWHAEPELEDGQETDTLAERLRVHVLHRPGDPLDLPHGPGGSAPFPFSVAVGHPDRKVVAKFAFPIPVTPMMQLVKVIERIYGKGTVILSDQPDSQECMTIARPVETP